MRTSVLLAVVWLAEVRAGLLPRQAKATLSLPAIDADPSSVRNGCEIAVNAILQSQERDGALLIRPSEALNCLMSVPVDVERNIALIDYLQPYIEMQSTIGYLRNPPVGYLLPGIDIMGALAEMRQGLSSGKFANQYHFMMTLQDMFAAAADGHFSYKPGLLSLFQFQSGLKLVSISSDGIQLPRIFAMDKFNQSQASGGMSPSPIAKINGVAIEDVLVGASFDQRAQDPDAQYNGLFKTSPSPEGHDSIFIGPRAIPDTFNVTFADGTTTLYNNSVLVAASLQASVANVSSGEDIHRIFEIVDQTQVDGPDAPTPTGPLLSAPTPTGYLIPAGYPQKPFVSLFQGYIHGYMLDSPDHQDVCVLAIESFKGEKGQVRYEVDSDQEIQDEIMEARRVTRKLAMQCKAAGRTRLVIDVQGNGGGYVYVGHEIYRNLFPTSNNWSGARFRVTKLFHFIASISPRFLAGHIGLDQKPLQSNIEAFLGPVKSIKEDNMTEIALLDFGPWNITGYNATDASAPKQPPFKPEDIIVVTDGVCHSTCANFVGLLQREAGVRTVALGGRPMEKPMQAIGGVKGSTVASMKNLKNDFKRVNVQDQSIPPDVVLPEQGPPPLQPKDLGSINWKNAYPEGAPENSPPVHFIYEAAHCRRFFRAEYLLSAMQVWMDVADVAWKGAQCVRGSTVNSDGKIPAAGGKNNAGTLPYSDDVRSQGKYTGLGTVNGGEAPKGKPPSSAGSPGEVGKKDDKNGAVRTPTSRVGLLVGAVVAASMLWI